MEYLQNMTEKQRRAVIAIAENISEGLTETELAKRAGVSRQHLWELRKKPEFQEALREAVRDELAGKVDYAAKKLLQKVDEGNVKCLLTLLELTGLYAPVQRVHSMNVNVNADKTTGKLPADTGKMPADIRHELVQRWHELGWTPDDFMSAWQTVENE